MKDRSLKPKLVRLVKDRKGILTKKPKLDREEINKVRNPSKIDPTRTITLRRTFGIELKRRFGKLKAKILKLIVDEDALGLKESSHDPFDLHLLISNQDQVQNTRWKFSSDPEKLKAFRSWLKTQIDQDIIGMSEEELFRRFAEAGFRKGAGRAFDDTNKVRKSLSTASLQDTALYEGGKDQFLRSAFANPVSIEKVQLLASRSYNDLVGVTDAMATSMGRTLADGLVQGKSPREVAKDLVDDVEDVGETRALTIARTEIIRAHAEGQLDALEQLGVDEVGVAVEWTVTPDDRVCPLCEPLEGLILSIDEARGMLPRHPNCFLDPNTLVSCRWGTKRIKDVQVGDEVITHHLLRPRKVIQTHLNVEPSCTAIRIDTNEGKTILVTADHPILAESIEENSYYWKPAKDIQVGDRLLTDYSQIEKVISTYSSQEDGGGRGVTLYNLSVEEDESYFANHIAVHNCRCCWIPANVGEDGEGQTDTKGGIDKALDTSAGRESSASKSEGEEGGSWGPGEKISKDRPESTLNLNPDPLYQFSSLIQTPIANSGFVSDAQRRAFFGTHPEDAKSAGESEGGGGEKSTESVLAHLDKHPVTKPSLAPPEKAKEGEEGYQPRNGYKAFAVGKKAAARFGDTETVDLKDLISTQDYLSNDHVKALVAKGSKDLQSGEDLPIVIKQGGKLYVGDGHHRIEALHQLGHKSIKAIVVPLNAEGKPTNPAKPPTSNSPWTPTTNSLTEQFPYSLQGYNWDCGAACLRAVGKFYGVSPNSEKKYIDLLGSNPKDGTRVTDLVRVAKMIGLDATLFKDDEEATRLQLSIAHGIPIICPVQMYGETKEYDEEEKKDEDGHYIVVLSMDGDKIQFEDPADPKGRGEMPLTEFIKRWHDVDVGNKKYVRTGIAVKKSLTPSVG